MRRLEDFMNWLTDMDSGWWPVLSLRPLKDRDIDNRVLRKISLIYGAGSGIALFLLLYFPIYPGILGMIVALAGCYLFGCVAFFGFYKVSFAYFWNRRARRLRGESSHQG